MSQATQVRWSKQELMEIARCQKAVLWVILLSFAGLFVPLAPLVTVVVTGTIRAYFMYKLAVALRSPSAWVYLITAFIPYVGIITVLYMNNRATVSLQSNGIKVGLMGAKIEEVEKGSFD